ncbi:MAG: hypothetical protein Q7J75_02205 [Rhodoferax sp.]|nr:hypothetical protein [Rhodoferax sp.]
MFITLTEKGVENLIAQWLAMTPKEKEDVKREVVQLHEMVLKTWEELPLNNALMAFVYAIKHREPTAGYAIKRSLQTAERYGVPEAVYVIERAILHAMFSPDALAWEQACQYLTNALNDPLVKGNPVVSFLLGDALDTALDGWFHPNTENLFYRWESLGAREAASSRASNAAKSKNAVPRDWVLSAWNSRADKGQKKAAFSRQYAALVKSKFGVIVTPVTIERSWLPKG